MASINQAGASLAGVILAGGRSRRMGGLVKALLPLGGKPLLQHVIDRVRPQTAQLILSVERPSKAFEEFGLRQIADPEPDRGPLMGLLCAMQFMEPAHRWLLLVPCDAPFLPVDLAARLLAIALDSNRPAAVVRYESQIQPTFSVWRRDLLPWLERGVREQGMAGLKQFMEVTKPAELDWKPTAQSPFFNVNDHDALLEAGSLLGS